MICRLEVIKTFIYFSYRCKTPINEVVLMVKNEVKDREEQQYLKKIVYNLYCANETEYDYLMK